ncbi:MAG: type IV pili twitching motility protein PilT, partial [Cyanobacteria bacterium J06628_6]
MTDSQRPPSAPRVPPPPPPGRPAKNAPPGHRAAAPPPMPKTAAGVRVGGALTLEKLVREAFDKGYSDVHLGVGEVPRFR